MRIATSMIFQRSVNAMLDKQTQVSKTQMQLSSGERLLSPADDPVAAARVLNLDHKIGAITQYQRNAERVGSRLELEDTSLSGAVNVLQRVRELTVQASNDTLSASDRRALAQEVRQMRDDLFGLANTQDPQGEYIFSGLKGDTPAFSAPGTGSYPYNGDLGQRTLRIADDRQIADGDHGDAVFGHIPTQLDANGDGVVDGNGYRNILETVDLLAQALDGTASGPGSGNIAEDARHLPNYLTEIDAAMGNLLDVRAKVGARQNAIDNQQQVHDDVLLVMQKARSDNQDLDYTEAISRFQQQLTALQASQQSFAKIQDLSLFKFL